MNYDQLVKDLKNRIPANLNSIEIAKYIYIELCKMKSFDIEYNYADDEEKSIIYKDAKKNKENLNNIVAKDEQICLSLAYLYKALLNEWNIDSETNDSETNMLNQHIYNVIKINNKEILTDITEDMYNIKGGFKTEHFGEDSKWFKSEKIENEDIDKKIGYIKSKDDYTDNILERIKEKVENKNLENSIDYIIGNKELKNKIQKDIKHIENTKILKKILKIITQEDYGKKLYMFDCYSEKEPNKRVYRPCIIIQEKQGSIPIPYIYSDKNKNMVKLSFEELDKLVNDGLEIGVNKDIKGANILKKSLKKYRASIKKQNEIQK